MKIEAWRSSCFWRWGFEIFKHDYEGLRIDVYIGPMWLGLAVKMRGN